MLVTQMTSSSVWVTNNAIHPHTKAYLPISPKVLNHLRFNFLRKLPIVTITATFSSQKIKDIICVSFLPLLGGSIKYVDSGSGLFLLGYYVAFNDSATFNSVLVIACSEYKVGALANSVIVCLIFSLRDIS